MQVAEHGQHQVDATVRGVWIDTLHAQQRATRPRTDVEHDEQCIFSGHTEDDVASKLRRNP